MQVAKRVAKNTGFLYARMGITVLMSLYTTRLVLSALGAEDYGIYNVVGGAVAMLTFLNAAMTSASQRFMSFAQGEGNEDKQKSIFSVSAILHLIISFLVFVILEIGGYFIFNGILDIPEDRVNVAKLVFQFMIVSTFFTIISVPYSAVINAHENMLFFAILGVVEAFFKLFIALTITYISYDRLKLYGMLMVVLPIITFSIRAFYCHKKYSEVHFRIREHLNLLLFKEMASFAGWTLLSSFASIITMQGISILLNSFFGVVVNAAQAIANQISGQLMAFSNTMLKALRPVIVKSEGGKDRAKMLEASMIGNKLSFFLLGIFSIPVIIEMPFILDVWLKDVPDFATVFCRLNLIRLSFSQLTSTFSAAIGAIGKIKQVVFFESLIYLSLLPVSYFMFEYGASPETIYKNLILMVIGLFVLRVYFLNRLGGLSIRSFMMNVVIRCSFVFILSLSVAIAPVFFVEEGISRLVVIVLLSSFFQLAFISLFGLNSVEKNQMRMLTVSFIRLTKKLF